MFRGNELSEYDMGIVIKQKWVRKYWSTMEYMEQRKFIIML